jgi:predicted dehydrogenase
VRPEISLPRESNGGRIRFGILGAARIAPKAIVKPARQVPGVEVVAVAARDLNRARQFAQAYSIPRVFGSYDELVSAPEVDAVYNPLPNSLHYEWTVKALRAGKHVLCEKPLAANAREADEMARTADGEGRVLMEAFHYRYHPLAQRILEIVASGEIGAVREIEAYMCFPLLKPKDIRFSFPLAGGATMDAGCYCINLIRAVGGSEPKVTRARALLFAPRVDRWMRAEFEFANAVRARMTCSMLGFPVVRIEGSVRGDRGEVRATNPFVPQMFHSLTVRTEGRTRHEAITREPTYNFQLRAFLGAVRGTPTNLTNGHDGVRNMRVIDAVYRKAGLTPRGE